MNVHRTLDALDAGGVHILGGKKEGSWLKPPSLSLPYIPLPGASGVACGVLYSLDLQAFAGESAT